MKDPNTIDDGQIRFICFDRMNKAISDAIIITNRLVRKTGDETTGHKLLADLDDLQMNVKELEEEYGQ